MSGFKTEDFVFLLYSIPNKVLETVEVIFDTVLKKISVDIKNAKRLFFRAIILLEGEYPKEGCEWCNHIK